MLQIWKYQIDPGTRFKIEMPKHSKILKVENQLNIPCMWVLVHPEFALETRRFIFVGTGHPIDFDINQLEFISTFQMQGGTFIFHIFEVKELFNV